MLEISEGVVRVVSSRSYTMHSLPTSVELSLLHSGMHQSLLMLVPVRVAIFPYNFVFDNIF